MDNDNVATLDLSEKTSWHSKKSVSEGTALDITGAKSSSSGTIPSIPTLLPIKYKSESDIQF